MIINNIDTKDISVVVQGAIDKVNTPICLKSIRKYLPGAEIILSTWEGSDVEGLDYDILILNQDPLGFAMNEISTEINNVKRQICSTLNGIKKSANKYIFKIRSDLKLESANFLNFFNKYNNYDENWRMVNSRILVSSIASRDPREWECPYCISDWIHFGFSEDIFNLWNIEYPTKEEEQWFTIHPRDVAVIYKYPTLVSRFNPEQFIITKFLGKNKKSVSGKHMFDNNKYAQEETLKVIANNFTILSPKMYSFKFMKKSNRKADRWRILTHVKWLSIYNEFGNGKEKIPFIDFERLSYYRNKRTSDKRLVKQLSLNFKKKHIKKVLKCPPWDYVDVRSSECNLMSIVIPCHGRIDLLKQTLESIVVQTSKNFNVIISDDSESELERVEIKQLVQQLFGKNNIPYKYIFTEACLGQTKNTNQGLEQADGKYVRILHSDDILHPQTIQHEIETFELFGDKICCLYHKHIAFSDNMPNFSTNRIKESFKSYKELVMEFLHSGTAVPSDFVYPNIVLKNIGVMNAEYKRACDWEFFYRFVKYAKDNNLKVLEIPMKYIGYRTHQNSNTNNPEYSLINFFEYKKISDLISKDMELYKFNNKDIYTFRYRATKYRYCRFLREVKKIEPDKLEKFKDIIWRILNDSSDIEYIK